MKRASYRHAIAWIADNDEPSEMDVEVMASLVSVVLVADLFGVEPERVATEVVRLRILASRRSA